MISKIKTIETCLFTLILLVILIFRYQVLLQFSYKYTDSDQSIMWHSLLNYSEGKFHEPRFYGQSYNTMLESLFAVPLYKMGVPFYKALPLVTSFITLFPYVLIAFFTIRKKSFFAGLIILSIPLLLPIEYDLITTLPRGFVTGIFVASFGTISLFYPKSLWGFFLLSFTSVIGYSVNANSVLLSLPCLFYIFLINWKNLAFYIYSSIGLILGGIIHFWVNSFYTKNIGYNLHKYSFNYSFSLLKESINNLDLFFNNVSPIFWKQGFVLLLIFLLVGIVLLYKRRVQLGLFLLLIPILTILTMGISKIHDGTNSVFFSLSRMYLALPILIGISLSFISKSKPIIYLYFIIPISLLSYKCNHLEDSINQNINTNKNHVVSVAKVDYIIEECENLNKLCENYTIDLVIIVSHYNYDFFNYGCSMCAENFPKTLRPIYERRTWRLIEDENKTYKNILFIDNLNALDEKFDFVEKIEFTKDIFIVKNNQLSTMKLLDKMDIEIRKYK